MSFNLQLMRDGVDIPGATANTYTIQDADKGHTLSVRVVATNVAGSQSATSTGVDVPASGAVLAISGTAAPSGVVGSSYSFTPTIVGGESPYVVSIISGNLPSGTSLTSSTGAFSGTLTTAQVRAGIVLRVTDNAGATADLALGTITIAATGTTVNPTTWFAALQVAGPGAVLIMDAGDYGAMGVFRASPIAAPGVTLQGQAGVICSGGMEIAATGVNVAGITITGLVSGNYAISIGNSDRISVDSCTIPGNNPGAVHAGVGIFSRNCTNVTITNNTLANLGDGIDGLDCSNVVVASNHITKCSDNFIFWSSVHDAVFEKNYLSNMDFIDTGTHPDSIQIASTGDTGRSSNVTIRNNNFDAMNGNDEVQGIGFCEDVDVLTITGNCVFGASPNGTAMSRSTNVTVTDNFEQGWANSPRIFCRGGCNIVNFTGNWCASTPFNFITAGETPSTNVTIGTNTLIANATSSADTGLRATWLSTHPLVPTS